MCSRSISSIDEVMIFHPIFLTPDEIALLRKRLADRACRPIAEKALLKPARRDLEQPWQIPGPFWAEDANFCDSLTGAPLIYDPRQRGRYESSSGAWVEGPAHDWAWNNITHTRLANRARRGALAGLLTEDIRLLEESKKILLAYAQTYLDYPPRGRQSSTWGRLYHQALDESVWSLSLLWTTECLWHAGQLTAEELDFVFDNLFLPISDLVWGEWYAIHNIRMWHNAAIGCIGLACRDRRLIAHAIHGDKGFRQQLVDGYRWKDGLSCEGTLGYHGYGLTAMLFLAEAMQRQGFDPYHDPHLLRAILVPFRTIQPDGTPPNLGDMVRSRSLPTRLYATALGRYPDHPEIRAAAALAFSQWQEAGFSFQADVPRQLDLLFHPAGTLISPAPEGDATTFEALGLADGTVTAIRESLLPLPPFSLCFGAGSQVLTMEFLEYPEGARLLLGEALSDTHDHRQRSPFLCLRVTAQKAQFVTRLSVGES